MKKGNEINQRGNDRMFLNTQSILCAIHRNDIDAKLFLNENIFKRLD